MSSKEISFYENINIEPFISILKLTSSYASEPVIIYKNNEALHVSWLYTPDFICNHKRFRYWRYQQCLNYELFEKSAILFGLCLYSAYHSLIWICGLDSKTICQYIQQITLRKPLNSLETEDSRLTLHQHLRRQHHAHGDRGDPRPSSFTTFGARQMLK